MFINKKFILKNIKNKKQLIEGYLSKIKGSQQDEDIEDEDLDEEIEAQKKNRAA